MIDWSGTGGYGCYRIPTLVRTEPGTLLAYAEARTSPSCADRGAIDIVVRRSTNEGRTWGPVRVVLSGENGDPEAPFTHGNPAPVAEENGKSHLLSIGEPATPGAGPREAFVQTSEDDDLTFGPPRPASRLRPELGGWLGTSPAHGIQLKNGDHPGRLVVGAYQGRNDKDQYAGVLYSDDHGATWHPGASQNSLQDDRLKPGEAAVAELTDGRVYVGARNEVSSLHRAYALTGQDGTTTPAFKSLPVTTANTQASLLTLRKTYDKKEGDTLLMAAPSSSGDSGTDRRDLRLYAWNTSAAQTAPNGDPIPDWKPVGDLVKPGKSGYSDLAELTNGEIGLIYESGNLPGMSAGADWSAATVNFRRIDPRPLFTYTTEGKPAPGTTRPAAPTTPDASPHANDAYFSGDATLGAGRFGQGLQLDGAGGKADVPYGHSLDPGDGKFTYSLFFRHNAAATAEPAILLSAYGVTPDAPQVWIRAEPQANRILAHVQGTEGTAEVSVPGTAAFSGDAWKHLTLVRDGTKITLRVEDTTSTSQNGEVRGAVTSPPTAGNHGLGIGARVDTGYRPFKGGIDEVRLYRTALDKAQIDSLKDRNTTGTAEGHLTLRLPFHVIDKADAAALTAVSIAEDVAGKCVDGTVLGGVTPSSRVGGHIDTGALAVDADHPGVETPFHPNIDVGSRAFTYALWFKHKSSATTSPDQTLLWAYGENPEATTTPRLPSLGAVIEPKLNRVRAWAQTPQGRVEHLIPGPAGFGDDKWHLLTLTRDTAGFRLGVDRTLTAWTPLTGAFRPSDGTTPLGLRVGSKPGGGAPLTGAIDDVRHYDRAFTAAEVNGLVPGPGEMYEDPGNTDIRLRWSMEPGNVQEHSVTRPTATGQSTPDASEHCNNAYVKGAFSYDGRFGKGLKFNSTGGTVTLPYTETPSRYRTSSSVTAPTAAGPSAAPWTSSASTRRHSPALTSTPSRRRTSLPPAPSRSCTCRST
ncbi:LamG-like jellyroll fold domain-containing protein [Streptomyces sp. NPDC059874]|uniref:LamG-like jellyroll fold domain-containing protein n=1 Tax=Streptomyces sp. NPDC059874 TaxID=3346983 RepID=UPI003656AAC0